MKKIITSFLFIAGLFVGCGDKDEAKNDISEPVPSDVTIAQPDANVTIDEQLPPEPVSYTHLDVYKRQVSIEMKIAFQKM